MDPYSAEGELVNIHTAFHQAQYNEVLAFDTSSFSPSNALPARILRIRAHLALHQPEQVLSQVSPTEAESTPDLAAARTAARYLQGDASALPEAESLASTHASNLTVQILIGTVLAAAGNHEAALTLLHSHQGSLDAVALIIQIQLLQNRPDLAASTARSARSFAQDALLVNLAESWIGMREGGEKYQQAFYVFEELAQSPSQTSVKMLVSQAVSELLLGRYQEAEVALQSALERDGGDVDALANAVVLYAILGDEGKVGEIRGRLAGAGESEFVKGLVEKKGVFEGACAKYSPKFEG
ncbi:coatomer epsilon subunit-domain-containing protein [Delphinella strobiligena]|nr:coatomer epsilon subunit-domain-containing protein [Delphinella strobiligena]